MDSGGIRGNGVGLKGFYGRWSSKVAELEREIESVVTRIFN